MSQERIYAFVKTLSAIGILLALYLLWEQNTQPLNPICSVNTIVNCNPVISGELAKTLGIPTPLYGLIGYITILFAAIQKKKRLLLAMASFGLAFCLWIGYRELFLLHVVCPVCITCQLIMISVFILGIILVKTSK